ncbi:alpha-1 2-mannosidase [Alteromonas halophila]|uniref:Alpha-1 2-mannosidase n=2 Tax=Alteromonas halophila TaxID=516698 RepID=A0A918MYX7_9ALTE|nr:alpha-1 2-mannosidase [Alteromonas halophila]
MLIGRLTGRTCLLLIMAVVGLTGCAAPAAPDASEKSAIDYVDPFIGTAGKGKTFPGATVPHGMVQLSPDNGRTGWDWIAGYFYPDTVLAGFSHKHLSGTGAGDLYDISFFPFTGEPVYRPLEGGPDTGTLSSTFSHENEAASPGYYQVFLDDYAVNVELTAAKRVGIQRYTPEHSRTLQVQLDLSYSRNWDDTKAVYLEQVDAQTVRGYRLSEGWAPDQRVYFYTRFSQPISTTHINKRAVTNNFKHKGKPLTAQFSFSARDDNAPLIVSTAISSVSMQGAENNWHSTRHAMDFDRTHQQARQRWQTELARVDIEASPDNLTQFYTAMYHASLAPRLFSDADGRYKGPDGEIHQSETPRYDFFSLWDTFRALHPWKTLIDTRRSADMMASLLGHYREAGRLPVWNFEGNETDMMMGYHAVPVLVDAYLKGIGDIDGDFLLSAAIQSANQDAFGLSSYRELGYVPFEERKWNVSLTLEYAFDDYAIGKLAAELDKPALARHFFDRAQSYHQHFDETTGFMRARNHTGAFRGDFDPNAYHPEDYCEANAWQYSFFVPHDVDGMIEMMGGRAVTSRKLDAMFATDQSVATMPEWISGNIGQYVHGNEPSHHVPYLYQFTGEPHKTQQRVREIMASLYTTRPDGLAGNEDAGQMSAWYLFSALGFYPVNPVGGDYVLGSPEVEAATLHLENGRDFHVRVRNQSPQNHYVKRVTLNNKPLPGFILTHRQIMAGGTLTFEMGETP